MALVAFDDVKPLLVCPRCRCPLAEERGSFRCTAAACDLSARGAFLELGGTPVLIDFDRSIVQPDDLRPQGARRDGRWPLDALPRRLRAWWKPANRVAAANTETLLSLLPGASPLVLVVGGRTIGNGVEQLYADRRARVVAFDIGSSAVTQFVADAHQIPLADGAVDAVVVQAVLEHVLDPSAVVSEIHRVLRPDGLVYAETPFLQAVHAGPVRLRALHE